MTKSNNALNIKMLYTSYLHYPDGTSIEDIFVDDETSEKILAPFFEENASNILSHISEPQIKNSTLEINFYIQNIEKKVILLPFLLDNNGTLIAHLSFSPEIKDLFSISYKKSGTFTENDMKKFAKLLEDNKSRLNFTLQRR